MNQDIAEYESFMRDASLKQATGHCYAVCAPILHGKARFDANHFLYSGAPDAPKNVIATEKFGVDNALGAYFTLNIVNDQLEVVNLFAVINQGLYLSREVVVEELDWQPAKQLSFNFECVFSFGAENYRFEGGHLLLRF